MLNNGKWVFGLKHRYEVFDEMKIRTFYMQYMQYIKQKLQRICVKIIIK